MGKIKRKKGKLWTDLMQIQEKRKMEARKKRKRRTENQNYR